MAKISARDRHALIDRASKGDRQAGDKLAQVRLEEKRYSRRRRQQEKAQREAGDVVAISRYQRGLERQKQCERSRQQSGDAPRGHDHGGKRRGRGLSLNQDNDGGTSTHAKLLEKLFTDGSADDTETEEEQDVGKDTPGATLRRSPITRSATKPSSRGVGTTQTDSNIIAIDDSDDEIIVGARAARGSKPVKSEEPMWKSKAEGSPDTNRGSEPATDRAANVSATSSDRDARPTTGQEVSLKKKALELKLRKIQREKEEVDVEMELLALQE